MEAQRATQSHKTAYPMHKFLLYVKVIGVGVSCRILYSVVSHLYVSCSGSLTSVGGKESYFFLLSFTCNYVVSV